MGQKQVLLAGGAQESDHMFGVHEGKVRVSTSWYYRNVHDALSHCVQLFCGGPYYRIKPCTGGVKWECCAENEMASYTKITFDHLMHILTSCNLNRKEVRDKMIKEVRAKKVKKYYDLDRADNYWQSKHDTVKQQLARQSMTLTKEFLPIYYYDLEALKNECTEDIVIKCAEVERCFGEGKENAPEVDVFGPIKCRFVEKRCINKTIRSLEQAIKKITPACWPISKSVLRIAKMADYFDPFTHEWKRYGNEVEQAMQEEKRAEDTVKRQKKTKQIQKYKREGYSDSVARIKARKNS